MGFLYRMFIRTVQLLVFFLVIILVPNLPPKTTFPLNAYKVVPSKDLKNSLEINYHLDGAEQLLKGRVYGPECLIARKNEIYTGIHGGEIIKLSGEHVTHVAKLGHPCEDIYEESRCGRPLGLAFDTLGNNLVVADAYYGLWLIDLTTGRKKLLVSPHQELEGKRINRKAKLFNSVTVDKQGNIYWTDSSSDFTLQDIVYSAFANPSGRLFKYDRSRNVSKVLLDNLHFANGVALSPNEDFVVVSETGAMRLIKFHLTGAQAGRSEVFVDGLPGLTDNLTPDADGIWVPLVIAADTEHPSSFAMLSEFPNLRLFLARLLALSELPFQLLHSVYPNKVCERFIHFIGHGESISFMKPKRATVVRLDWKGNILGSLHGFDKSVGSISHVLEFNDWLYLGSPWNRFLGRVKSPKSPKVPTVRVRNVRYEGDGLEASVKEQPDGDSSTKLGAQVIPNTKTIKTTEKPITTTTPTPSVTTPQSIVTTATPETTRPPTTIKTSKSASTPKPIKTETKSSTPPIETPEISATTATPKPTTVTKTVKRVPPKQPAPVEENIISDRKKPKPEKLKVISKTGEHVEL